MVELLKREVKILKIRKEILDKLNKNNIHTILELCNNSRIDLSKKDFIKEEINELVKLGISYEEVIERINK